MNAKKIKQCKGCEQWFSADEIVNDPDIRPIGMSFLANDFKRAYFFFQHEIPECRSSFLVDVTLLDQYIDEYIPKASLILTEDCARHCVRLEDLDNCQNACHNAPYRRFLLKMIEIKKKVIKKKKISVARSK
jgi:hypothetical protein